MDPPRPEFQPSLFSQPTCETEKARKPKSRSVASLDRSSFLAPSPKEELKGKVQRKKEARLAKEQRRKEAKEKETSESELESDIDTKPNNHHGKHN